MATISEGTYTTSACNVKVTLSWEVTAHSDAYSKIKYVIEAENTDDSSRQVTTTTWVSFTVEDAVTNDSFDTLRFGAAGSYNDHKYLLSGTRTVYHDIDGTKEISLRMAVSFGTFKTYGTPSTIEKTWTGCLPEIDVRATFESVPGTELGKSRTITISKASEHAGTRYVDLLGGCDYWDVIASKSSSESFSYTPSLNHASSNTTGTYVDLEFRLRTYYLNSSGVYSKIGDDIRKTVTVEIPTSVVPSCTIAVTDAMGYADRFGGYIFGNSKFKITVNPTLAYKSPIQKYTISANRCGYSSNPVTTDVVSTVGTNTISATITDGRGRSASASTTAKVLAYTPPAISFNVHRCNADGTDNISGGYCKVSYAASVLSYGVAHDNDRALSLGYKRTAESYYTTVQLPMGAYSVSGEYIFAADDASAYDIQMTVTDTFRAVTRNAPLSTAFALMHFNASGKGMAVGKLSEHNAFECGMQAHFYAGMTEDIPVLATADFNEMLTSGRFYVLQGKNGPGGSGNLAVNGFLEVMYNEEYAMCIQRLCYVRELPLLYYRAMISGTWDAWHTVSLT